jgi:hypothetical protein
VGTTLGVALAAAAAAFSWWEGGLRQSSGAAHAGIAAAIALVLVSAVALGRGRQAATAADWVRGPWPVRRHLAEDPGGTVAVVVWVVLAAAVIGWDLNSFAHQSHDLPTLSSIFGHVTTSRGGRAALVALWLALGTALALGWRHRR